MRENLISSQGKTAKVCYVNFRDTFTTLKKLYSNVALRIFLGNHMKAYPTFSTSFESVSLPDSTHIVAMQCVLSCLSKPCIKAHKIFHQNRSSRF